MTKTYILATENEQETINLGIVMAKVFLDQVICVSGDLGSGKTHLAKGLAQGLGIEKHVTSPTFNILNVYQNKNKSFYHMDAYRITDEEMIYDIDTSELLEPKGISLIEWAENIDFILPDTCVNVYIEKTDKEEKRIFYITSDIESIERMAGIVYENTLR